MASTWRQGACALAAFLIIACLQAWPLPARLTSHLTGPPSGDTGVYVWNTWVFGRELLERGGSPFSTSRIFSIDTQADLSLHNYTPFANLLAMPLQPLLGVVGAFNAVYLINVALAGFGMFLLARRLAGGDRFWEPFLAGVAFAVSPFLVARSAAHFSLISAAPLPLFVYWLDRAWTSLRIRDALATGVMLAWAGFSDAYYAVYCVMLGALLVGSRSLALTTAASPTGARRRLGRVVLDVAIVAIAVVVISIHVLGGGSIRVASISISMRSLYTPVLILTVLIVARVLLTLHLRLEWRPRPITGAHLRVAAAAAVVAVILLAPTIYAVGRRVVEGRMVSAPILWRSSAPGVDLAAVVAPNPGHPLAPQGMRDWLARQGGGYVENVATLPPIVLAVILWAWRATGFRPGRLWLTITGGFLLLALGPFIHFAGLNTHIPTPWALLRYVPIIGQARMPSRFMIVVMLGLAVMFAGALVALARRYPHHRRRLLAAIGLVLAFELWPAPRTLYSAAIPSIYERIAADPRPVRVLELPFGIRDGLSSIGDFSAASQFHQTLHGKPLVGGYLSRVSDRRKQTYLRAPVRRALITLSERRPLDERTARVARIDAPGFIARSRIGYVVMHTPRMTRELRDFAIDVFQLDLVASADDHELYVSRIPLQGAGRY
jgi:hypothetical protein